MTNNKLEKFLAYRKIVTLLFVGLFLSNITHAAKSTEPERMLQIKKQLRATEKSTNKIKLRDLVASQQEAGGTCTEWSCKPCRLVKKGASGTYEDGKKVPCDELKVGNKVDCDYGSSSECTVDYDSISEKLLE